MKFLEHLNSHITPEWRTQYISYLEMKKAIYKHLEEMPSPDEVESEVVARQVANFEQIFLKICDAGKVVF